MSKSAYPPKPFRETRRDVLIETMNALRLGLLVIAPEADDISAVHVPMLVRTDGDKLFLDCHVGVANPVWQHAENHSALIVFQGPHAYVHPGWYETKKQTGKAVPTWNYISVQARGQIAIKREANWLRAHVEVLSQVMEQNQADPWAVSDAPDDYIAQMLDGIVGLQIEVSDVQGVWKMSQNHPKGNRLGATEGLAAGSGTDSDVADIMRALETSRS